MAENVDGRLHFALAVCSSILKSEPKMPTPSRALIIGAMQLLLDADKYIKYKVDK